MFYCYNSIFSELPYSVFIFTVLLPPIDVVFMSYASWIKGHSFIRIL